MTSGESEFPVDAHDLEEAPVFPPQPSPQPPISALSLVGALAVVTLTDVLIFRGSGGPGWAVFTAAVLAIVWSVRRPRPGSGTWILATGVTALAVRTTWQLDPWAVPAAFALIFAFTCRRDKDGRHLPNVMTSALKTAFSLPLSCIRMFVAASGALQRVKWLRSTPDRWTAVLTPTGVVVAFLLLFRAANPVLRMWLDRAWQWLQENFFTIFLPSPAQVAFWIGGLALACALLLPRIAATERLNTLLGAGEALSPPAGDEEDTATGRPALNTLIAVNVLFLLYNALDATFLWVRKAPPAGVNFSDYARGGTAWLTAALALSTVVLGAVFSGRLNFHRRTPLLRRLSWAWLAQNALLAAGAYQRLNLYVAFNGLTRARIVGLYGITCVVFGLVLIAVKIQRKASFLWLVRRQLNVLAAALALLALTPLDLAVTAYNARIILSGELRPAVQFAVQPLSPEGIPPMLRLLDCKDEQTRRGVAAILRREQQRLEQFVEKHPRWTFREGSTRWALRALHAHAEALDAIQPPDHDWAPACKRFGRYTRQWY